MKIHNYKEYVNSVDIKTLAMLGLNILWQILME